MRKGPTRKDKAKISGRPFSKTPDVRGTRTASPRDGEHLIYGTLPVSEAIRNRPRSVKLLFVAEGGGEKRLENTIGLAREKGVPIEVVPKEKLARLLESDVNHQGIAAVTAPVEFVDLDDLIDGIDGKALFVILDGVEDPRNLGAVIRTAECAGADGVIIPERRAAGLTGTVSKSAAGATEFIKISQVANINRTIEKLKENSIWVVGTAGEAEMFYQDWDWTQPSAVILGAEGSGMHRLVRENCDVLVKIPMYGKIESLNVSVAAGVILFEARRQRGRGEE
ncbi:MAG: 23S rRNA (guanosine(2251)-2'-O)-methyltransferase RlmB [Chloracidobacterium sp.]|nr:23S rRNA (guanosine(2251)-2'-O)-methyltransferase RlmB [Chloracidobacterium sp.]